MDATRPGLIASASSDGTCKLWDLRTGRPTCTLRGADSMPMYGCALYSVAGQPFAFTGGLDEAVKVRVTLLFTHYACWHVLLHLT
jgi:WD40 repeat protein